MKMSINEAEKRGYLVNGEYANMVVNDTNIIEKYHSNNPNTFDLLNIHGTKVTMYPMHKYLYYYDTSDNFIAYGKA